MEKLAKRLIKVIEAQRRANFRRTQFKSLRDCPSINIAERSPIAKSKLKYRKDNKVQLNRYFDKWEYGAA